MSPIAFPPANLPGVAGPAAPGSAGGPAAKVSEKALKAAREFESMLLKHMLESMQKTARVGSKEKSSNSAYQSMAVEALADGIERGGGLGLADLVARSLEAEISGRSR